MPLSNTSLKLDADIKARLQNLAAGRRRGANRLMSEAIRDFVERSRMRA